MKTVFGTGASVAVLAAVSMLAVARPSAQSAFTQRELTVSPYVVSMDGVDSSARAARHDQLAKLAETAGDRVRAARHFAAACSARSSVTLDLTMADPSCQRARAMSQEFGIVDVGVALKQVEGMVRGWKFDFAGSLKTLREGLELGAGLNPDLPDSAPLVSVNQMLGAVLIERGEFAGAQTHLTFARDHCRTSGDSACVTYAETYLCRLHTMLGDYVAARTACDTAEAVGAIVDDEVTFANVYWMRGTLEAAAGRHQAALDAIERAWSLSHHPGGEMLQPILPQLMIDSLIKLGRLDDADRWMQHIDRAVKEGSIPFYFGPQIAMRRGQLALAHGRLDDALPGFTAASRSLIHEMSIRGHLQMAMVSKRQNDFPAARASLESAIAKIETSRTNVSGASLRTAYLTLHSRAYGELIGIRWDADGAAAAGDALQIAEKGRARALLDALASAQVSGAAAPTLDAKGVQATLGADDVLVEYVSLENRLLAITVTRDRVAFTTLPNAGTAADLASRVDFFSALVQESDEAALAPAARRLYADVLAPALSGVASSARTLIIAADGPLHRLPFDALGEPPLIDRWDVVTLPSASTLAQRTKRAAPTAAAMVVAVPEALPGLSALPAARAEADAIQQRLGGEVAELSGAGATRQELEKLGPGRFAVLHFASHAVVDEDRPLRSALMLTSGRSNGEGNWTAEDIYRSRLNADLVVLSACSTAAGATTPGEGVMSLARAFLYAGAQSTIATLWDVPDAPGPVFADILYRQLASGRTLGEATANARRELRRRGAPPRAWAAYVLTGNPKAIVRVRARTDSRLLSAGISGGLAMVMWIASLILFATKNRWRVGWQRPAVAGVALALAAIAVQPFPWREAKLDVANSENRSVSRVALTPAIYQGQITWSPFAGADEHIVEVFDNDGVLVGSPSPAKSPLTLPAMNAGGWIRIEARNHSQRLSRSALISIPAR